MDIQSYLNQTSQLANSVIYYSKVTKAATLRWYQLNRGELTTCGDTVDHPYHRHLSGQSAVGDLPLLLTSLDTGLEINFTQIQQHPKTKVLFLKNWKYRQTLLDNWGAFAHQRAYGILFPWSNSFNLKHGTILYYDVSLVEGFELTLMDDLQTWLYNSLHRWTNTGYVATDELYAAALQGIIVTHMVSQLVQLRNQRILTQEAHSFHIDAYLSDYGLEDNLNYLSAQQKFSLYKHLPWLRSNQGQQQAFTYLKSVLELDPFLKVVEYEAVSHEGDAVANFGNFTQHLELDNVTALTEQSLAEVERVFFETKTLGNLPLIDVSYQRLPSHYLDLKTYVLGMWGYLSSTGKYTDSIIVTLSNGSQKAMGAYQAFIYYALHSGYTNSFPVYWVQLATVDTLPFTPVDFATVNAENISNLTETAWGNMIKMKVWVEQAPPSELVNRMAVFTRLYGFTNLPLPDKETWLAEQQLPPADSSSLEQIFELFTSYSHSYVYLEQAKPLNYRKLLAKLTSISSHIVEIPLPTVQAQWISSPIFTLVETPV